MPNPIPDWDIARRIVKFIGTKQIKGEDVTLKEATRTVGLGRERIEKILNDREITYKITGSDEPNNNNFIILEHVPPNLAADAGISTKDLLRSYEEFMAGNRTSRAIRQRRLNKKKLENLKVKNFWNRNQETHENS